MLAKFRDEIENLREEAQASKNHMLQVFACHVWAFTFCLPVLNFICLSVQEHRSSK